LNGGAIGDAYEVEDVRMGIEIYIPSKSDDGVPSEIAGAKL
jgi:hypothetical protein